MRDKSTSMPLQPPGPYRTPTAETFLGITIVAKQSPVQLCFSLENGAELRLPIALSALEKLYRELGAYSDVQDRPR
jgi:hypothetical protein